MKYGFKFLVVTALVAAGCNNGDKSDPKDSDTGSDNSIPPPILIQHQILNSFPHDTLSYTEGLTFHDGTIFESTGAPDDPVTNNTWVGPIDLKTGKYEKKVDLGNKLFGEGITFLNGKMYQLTYRSKIGFVYDAKTFKKLRDFKYNSEGWGLTNDGKNLIMSTGTSNLYYLDPDSLTFIRMLAVQDNSSYDSNINELEYINGYIYANQWLTPYILKIDPKTGYVVGKLDMTDTINSIKAKYRNAMEMNGIAYDSTAKKVYITGKKWPFIYQISW